MKVSQAIDLLNLNAITIPDPDKEIEGGYTGDLLSWVMGRVRENHAWITIMSNINIVAVASLADVACIVLAEGVTVDETIRTTAEAKGINLYTSEKTAYELASMLARIDV